MAGAAQKGGRWNLRIRELWLMLIDRPVGLRFMSGCEKLEFQLKYSYRIFFIRAHRKNIALQAVKNDTRRVD